MLGGGVYTAEMEHVKVVNGPDGKAEAQTDRRRPRPLRRHGKAHMYQNRKEGLSPASGFQLGSHLWVSQRALSASGGCRLAILLQS